MAICLGRASVCHAAPCAASDGKVINSKRLLHLQKRNISPFHDDIKRSSGSGAPAPEHRLQVQVFTVELYHLFSLRFFTFSGETFCDAYLRTLCHRAPYTVGRDVISKMHSATDDRATSTKKSWKRKFLFVRVTSVESFAATL